MTEATGDERGRWRTFGERQMYGSPYVRAVQVDVELPGGERFWHDVVRLHRAVSVVLADEAGRVLLVRRHRFVQDRWGWEVPGGLVDGDEDPADAAVRELEEGTGYRAGRVEPLISFEPRAATVDAEHFVFAGRDPVKAAEPTEVSAVSRVEWVPLASIPGLIADGEIWDAGSLVALLRFLMAGS